MLPKSLMSRSSPTTANYVRSWLQSCPKRILINGSPPINQNVPKNHEGSAGDMESAGMVNIFRRSEATRKLSYTGYLGDGDSKSYQTVARATPPIYKNKNIIKLACCGHIQKRMGKKSIDKVIANKKNSFTDDRIGTKFKVIGGAGRLTQKVILRIQGHYGAAIRENHETLTEMKKAIWRIWSHYADDHRDCKDWCPVKSGKGPSETSLPKFVCQQIKPVFENLSCDELLKKFCHGGSQNANESFHQLIWLRCPKSGFVGRKRLELAVNDAVIVYNEGEHCRLTIFEALGLSAGRHLKEGLRKIRHEASKKMCIFQAIKM